MYYRVVVHYRWSTLIFCLIRSTLLVGEALIVAHGTHHTTFSFLVAKCAIAQRNFVLVLPFLTGFALVTDHAQLLALGTSSDQTACYFTTRVAELVEFSNM